MADNADMAGIIVRRRMSAHGRHATDIDADERKDVLTKTNDSEHDLATFTDSQKRWFEGCKYRNDIAMNFVCPSLTDSFNVSLTQNRSLISSRSKIPREALRLREK